MYPGQAAPFVQVSAGFIQNPSLFPTVKEEGSDMQRLLFHRCCLGYFLPWESQEKITSFYLLPSILSKYQDKDV